MTAPTAAPGAPVRVERDGPVARIVLDRPDALNALDPAMVEGLAEATAEVARDAALRCLTVAGAGGHFMAGGDVKAFGRMLAEVPAEARPERFAAMIERVHDTVRGLRALDVPVVAAVRGACAGFGLSLAMACDLTLAADDAVFALAYVHIAASPDGGATWHLPRLVGPKRAAEIALLGDRFDAAAAERLGLVNRVVAAASLDAEAEALARRLAAGPGAAIARTKALLRRSEGADFDAHLAAERDAFAASAGTADFAEGVAAFAEKRPPRFGG